MDDSQQPRRSQPTDPDRPASPTTTKVTRWRKVAIAVLAGSVAVGALALVGDSGGRVRHPWVGTGLDRPGWSACENFFGAVFGIGGPEHAYNLTGPQREQIVYAASELGRQSSVERIQSGAGTLDSSINRSSQTWRLGLDEFTTACSDNGWDATR
ncbi:MAG: hypothetical protein GEV09_21670 [Pseudonocardiaceae bacterium]|nr:hypothetical protein [Pseudonocardiaceae bacterium]